MDMVANRSSGFCICCGGSRTLPLPSGGSEPCWHCQGPAMAQQELLDLLSDEEYGDWLAALDAAAGPEGRAA